MAIHSSDISGRQHIGHFNTAIDKWYASPPGPTGRSTRTARKNFPGKIPSALEIFLNSAAFDNTNVFIPAPVNSQPIVNMTREWKACVNQNGAPQICPLIRSVTALLEANYDNYKS